MNRGRAIRGREDLGSRRLVTDRRAANPENILQVSRAALEVVESASRGVHQGILWEAVRVWLRHSREEARESRLPTGRTSFDMQEESASFSAVAAVAGVERDRLAGLGTFETGNLPTENRTR